MPRNIRNTRRNFARPSNTITTATSAAAPVLLNGSYGTSIDVTKVTNPVGPSGLGVYRVTSSPAGAFSGTITSTANTTTVPVEVLTTAATGTYTILVSDDNYNGTGRPVAVPTTLSITGGSLFSSTVLVIGGGGGGGDAFNDYTGTARSGGGGAGAYREFSNFTLATGINVPITVGAGGSNGQPGSNGSSSVFSTITATGGGGGAQNVSQSDSSNGVDGGAGASGGGAGGHSNVNVTRTGGVYSAPTNPAIVTNKELYTTTGASGGSRTTGSGGGGGASADGVSGGTGAGAGGAGRSSSITGSSVIRGGGGGGGEAAGGTGGGGNGGNNVVGTAGTANRGGGGGGVREVSSSYRAGGPGGSGVAIVRYPNTYTITIGAGLTGSTATDGSFKVTTITAGTGNVSFA